MSWQDQRSEEMKKFKDWGEDEGAQYEYLFQSK